VSNPVLGASKFQIHIKLNQAGGSPTGIAPGETPGVVPLTTFLSTNDAAGDDFYATGTVVDFSSGSPVILFSGTLLTGEIKQNGFGFSDTGTTDDAFDFRMTPTG